jgi:hypothetical protein
MPALGGKLGKMSQAKPNGGEHQRGQKKRAFGWGCRWTLCLCSTTTRLSIHVESFQWTLLSKGGRSSSCTSVAPLIRCVGRSDMLSAPGCSKRSCGIQSAGVVVALFAGKPTTTRLRIVIPLLLATVSQDSILWAKVPSNLAGMVPACPWGSLNRIACFSVTRADPLCDICCGTRIAVLLSGVVHLSVFPPKHFPPVTVSAQVRGLAVGIRGFRQVENAFRRSSCGVRAYHS